MDREICTHNWERIGGIVIERNAELKEQWGAFYCRSCLTRMHVLEGNTVIKPGGLSIQDHTLKDGSAQRESLEWRTYERT